MNKEISVGLLIIITDCVIYVFHEQLEKNIFEFDEKEYGRRLDSFHKDIELIFDGKASCKIADKLEVCIRL